MLFKIHIFFTPGDFISQIAKGCAGIKSSTLGRICGLSFLNPPTLLFELSHGHFSCIFHFGVIGYLHVSSTCNASNISSTQVLSRVPGESSILMAILITKLATFWYGRISLQLERYRHLEESWTWDPQQNAPAHFQAWLSEHLEGGWQ